MQGKNVFPCNGVPWRIWNCWDTLLCLQWNSIVFFQSNTSKFQDRFQTARICSVHGWTVTDEDYRPTGRNLGIRLYGLSAGGGCDRPAIIRITPPTSTTIMPFDLHCSQVVRSFCISMQSLYRSVKNYVSFALVAKKAPEWGLLWQITKNYSIFKIFIRHKWLPGEASVIYRKLSGLRWILEKI